MRYINLWLIDWLIDDLSVKLNADDVKVYSVIDDIGSSDSLTSGLNSLCDWCATWQIKINASKCFVFHIGHSCSTASYNIGNTPLPVSNVANHLGVNINPKLRFSYHYHNLIAKANQRASLILGCFECQEPAVLFHPFTTFVRPIVEYYSPVWASVYKCDINLIESVQRRFTKKLNGLRYLSYEQRLNALTAESLELRRLKLDLSLIHFWRFHASTCERPLHLILAYLLQLHVQN